MFHLKNCKLLVCGLVDEKFSDHLLEINLVCLLAIKIELTWSYVEWTKKFQQKKFHKNLSKLSCRSDDMGPKYLRQAFKKN